MPSSSSSSSNSNSNILLVSPIFIACVILLGFYLYKRYEDKQMFLMASSPNFTMKMFQNYLLGNRMLIKEEIGNITKPILWIHVPYEYNSRNWESFGSRSSYELNQPYLYLTLKSIIQRCQEDFQIIIVDDASFTKVLEDYKINPSTMTCVQRQISMLKLLETYGGMILPLSFVCLRGLAEMFAKGTENNLPFVGEKANHQANVSNVAIPDLGIVGTRIRNDPEISELIRFLEEMEKKDAFTLASSFEGRLPTFLANEIQLGKINLISAKEVGTQNAKGKIVLIEELLSPGYLNFDLDVFGIWIPSRDILQRTNFQWFARMSQKQIVHSDLVLAKYLLLANDNLSSDSSSSSLFSFFYKKKEGMQNLQQSILNQSPTCNLQKRKRENINNNQDTSDKMFHKQYNDWRGWWKTPLLPKGMYGMQPLYLGQTVPKATDV